ncbi:Acyl-CoA dehydrogenase family member 11 [Rhodococcus opacus PD630]|nr:Acyl-CoA dehydrogenase family member 11 [Rhodococcus opacus PD630]
MSLFDLSDRAQQLQTDLLEFMDSRVYPAEAVYEEQMRESGDPHFQPPVLEELKVEARRRGLWNLFHPHPGTGAGLTNLEYAPLAEIMGRSHIASEACNCNAPDTGNMEVLELFGTAEHKEKYLTPLLEGTMASAFAMTEPAVASSDATNVELSMVRDGDEYVLNGRKWFASNALHRNCRVLIVMGKTDPSAAPHRQQSMMVVPIDAPGVTVMRGLPVFGYQDREGHAEIDFADVRVPVADVLKGEGEGFGVLEVRLGRTAGENSGDPLGVAATRAVVSAGDVLQPEQVADIVLDAVDRETFLILPHESVLAMYRQKGSDYDRWLRGMRRYQSSLLEHA